MEVNRWENTRYRLTDIPSSVIGTLRVNFRNGELHDQIKELNEKEIEKIEGMIQDSYNHGRFYLESLLGKTEEKVSNPNEPFRISYAYLGADTDLAIGDGLHPTHPDHLPGLVNLRLQLSDEKLVQYTLPRNAQADRTTQIRLRAMSWWEGVGVRAVELKQPVIGLAVMYLISPDLIKSNSNLQQAIDDTYAPNFKELMEFSLLFDRILTQGFETFSSPFTPQPAFAQPVAPLLPADSWRSPLRDGVGAEDYLKGIQEGKIKPMEIPNPRKKSVFT